MAKRSRISHRGEFCVESPKTVKGEILGWLSAVLYFAPHRLANRRRTVCSCSSPECRKYCLNKSGHGRFSPAQKARIRRTREYFRDPRAYEEKLAREVVKLLAKAKRLGMRLCIRVCGTSDLPALARALAKRFPEVMWYDYTKIPKPWTRELPNYFLTFSRSELNEADCVAALAHGIPVAVVFSTKKGEPLPKKYWGRKVWDGDTSDLRFPPYTPRGVIVGLRAKGPARKAPARASGFVVDAAKAAALPLPVIRPARLRDRKRRAVAA